MTAALALQPEWDRLDLLGRCLERSRRGAALDELTLPLQQVQAAVAQLRAGTRWGELLATEPLDELDQDILACVSAPEVAPRLGWAYLELQPGVASHYPSPALMQELMFLSEAEAPGLRARLQPRAPLRRAELIEHAGGDYQPVLPTARARAWLQGHAGGGTAAHGLPAACPPGASELPAQATWDDLVVPAACRNALNELLLWETQREHVENAWGARLGGGPVALFAGPSGTGKTLAAEVLATALGYRLLRADLGALVSKYIGETEKNLNALFDAAQGRPVVLLFDEADALFGRRGDVKDAHDRYANMEVSHLLTRIEQHRGPCVLTSNLRQHLDPAFVRRFHVVVEFNRPERAERQRLWQCHLPPRAPLGEGVTPERLADAAALSGAQIRGAAHRAALLAAAEGSSLQAPHLACGIWRELAKEGREMSPQALGWLAPHLPKAER